MGHNPCILCGIQQSCCDVCQHGYCLNCDISYYHNQGVPYLTEGHRTLKAFHQAMSACSKGASKCSAPDCFRAGLLGCTKRSCCGNFCQDHMTHMHFGCCYKDCKQRAITYTLESNVIDGGKCFCKFHYNCVTEQNNKLYLEKKSYNYYSSPYGRCNDCRVALTADRASIKYCVQCNIKWIALKKQGIRGPFG